MASIALASTSTVGDVGALYAQLSTRLERIVRLDVRATDAVIEDACQFAWARLVYHHERVRAETALSWLAKTAIHEAFKLIRRESREMSLEAALETEGDSVLAGSSPAADDLVQCVERLRCVRLLAPRQQRILWLHMLGLSYAEIADHERCTIRTVERQLLLAKRRVRTMAGQ